MYQTYVTRNAIYIFRSLRQLFHDYFYVIIGVINLEMSTLNLGEPQQTKAKKADYYYPTMYINHEALSLLGFFYTFYSLILHMHYFIL